MSRQDRSSVSSKIDRKWVREEKRTFSVFPGLPRTWVLGEEESWLELMQFYLDDLKWLLSLDHHKFWSHMIYSEKAHEQILSFLKGSPPYYMKNRILVQESMKNIFTEVEHLVFLVFLRLSVEKESEGCFMKNFGEIIYNNYLFTVPIILDLCLIYGSSNPDLVKKIIYNVIAAAPDFLDDFQEVIPHFFKALKTVKEKFSLKSAVEDPKNYKNNEIQDLILYLCDSVATIQVFFELYPNVCQLFNKSEIIIEIVVFYSNVLPEMVSYCLRMYEPVNEDSLNSVEFNLIENIRIDMLKITKSVFDFLASETNYILDKREEKINEYLALMLELLSEPTFLFDYNMMYSIEFEIECAVKNCPNVDSNKINFILKEVARTIKKSDGDVEGKFTSKECDITGVKLNSLITEVKDIFPHLEESFIRQCLSSYNNNTEKVIAAVLENFVPCHFSGNGKSENALESYERKPKHKHRNLNEMLNDREEINKIKERYALFSFVANDDYDDEYDDTYDDNAEVPIAEGYEMERRPFVVPRVLRKAEETEEEEDEGDEEGGGEEEDNIGGITENSTRLNFVENPSILREQSEQRRIERSKNVIGRSRGRGQSRQVLKNREYKESHKSFMGNHNRKREAGRKFSKGMIPS